MNSSRDPRHGRRVALPGAALLVGTALILGGCNKEEPPPPAGATQAPLPSAKDFAESGIQVDSLRLTAADYMLDLRFRITDPERAGPFFERNSTFQLVDEATGTRLEVPNTPKLGRLRQVARRDMGGRSYFMLFANPGRFIKPGTQMTLVIGDMKLRNLQVEGGGTPHEHPAAKL